MPAKSFLGVCALALPLCPACMEASDATESGVGGASSRTVTAADGTTTTGVGSSGGAGGSAGAVSTAGTSSGAGATSSATGTGTTSTGTSGGTGGGSDPLFVPEGLSMTKLDGAGEGLGLVALTLLQRLSGAELYGAVKNDSDTSACDAAITIEFLDKTEQSLAAWVGGLYSGQLYRRSDGTDAILACLDPGELAMIGSTGLPDNVLVDEVGSLVYRFTYFDRDVLPFEVVPIDTLTVSQLESVSLVSGSAFTGTLQNGLDVAVSDPIITIFPLNGVGRPLGMATSGDTVTIPSGGTWRFETSVVNDTGVERAVYPGAFIASE